MAPDRMMTLRELGFRLLQKEDEPGLTVTTMNGDVFAWAETLEQAMEKIAREQRERIFSSPSDADGHSPGKEAPC